MFRSVVGETLAEFVKARRPDRSLHLMAHGGGLPLTEVAFGSGFSSSSDFSRCFRQRFGVAPSAFDLGAWREAHRTELEQIGAGRWRSADAPAPGENPDGFEVRIRDLPARTVAYTRVADPYRAGGVADAAARLLAWAERRGIADHQWLGYQWENPEITPLQDCFYNVAVEHGEFAPAGEIGRYRFPPMTVAQVEVRGTIDIELRALQWLYNTWLPASVYVPDDLPCFEAWIGRPFAHGTERFELHAQLPVRRG